MVKQTITIFKNTRHTQVGRYFVSVKSIRVPQITAQYLNTHEINC